MSHPSKSTEQQSVEEIARGFLATQTGFVYERAKIVVDGEYVEIDAVGTDDSGKVVHLAEIYARHGKLKSSQKHKSIDDAARLVFARTTYPDARLSLAWCSLEAIDHIKRGWRGKAIEAMGIDLIHVPVSNEIEQAVRAAQLRQTR